MDFGIDTDFFCHSQVNLFLHKAKIKHFYFHLNLFLSLFYSLSSFFFQTQALNSPFSAFYFFCAWKCVLIRACYCMYASQSKKKTFRTAWVTWTTNHMNWNWPFIGCLGSKFTGVSITFLAHCLESYCCFCLLTLYVMFVL